MKGYIYTMYQGADPAKGWKMTDPIYGDIPTLGSCMPNIRKAVEKDDYIFSISGRVKGEKQYVVSGFSVDEKINQLAAFERFPDNRFFVDDNGIRSGNIIIDKEGKHIEEDYHTNHEKRISNYIIGKNPIVIEGEEKVKKAREETLIFLNSLFNKQEDAVHKVVARWRKLDEAQIKDLLSWMKNIQRQDNE